jgi:hypothetical protein
LRAIAGEFRNERSRDTVGIDMDFNSGPSAVTKLFQQDQVMMDGSRHR